MDPAPEETTSPPAAIATQDVPRPKAVTKSRGKGRGQKRKRVVEKKETLELLRETHRNINDTTLKFMKEKHEKETEMFGHVSKAANDVSTMCTLLKEKHEREIETLLNVSTAAKDFSTMCNTVNTFFSNLNNSSSKIVFKN